MVHYIIGSRSVWRIGQVQADMNTRGLVSPRFSTLVE